jgi:hypothetical protein
MSQLNHTGDSIIGTIYLPSISLVLPYDRCLVCWKEKLFSFTKTDIVYLVQTDNIIGVIKLRAFLKVNYRCLPFKVDNDLIQRNINLFDIWTCRDFLIFLNLCMKLQWGNV